MIGHHILMGTEPPLERRAGVSAEEPPGAPPAPHGVGLVGDTQLAASLLASRSTEARWWEPGSAAQRGVGFTVQRCWVFLSICIVCALITLSSDQSGFPFGPSSLAEFSCDPMASWYPQW